MNNEQYDYLADQLSGKFLRAWALSTEDSNAEYEDDLAAFLAFDGIQ